MGFFDTFTDTFKVMKDIVDGGIEAYKAGEKLDALIEKISSKHRAALTDDEKLLLKQYRKSARAYRKRAAKAPCFSYGDETAPLILGKLLL